jgi:Fur family transcriptional regulator, ferric uptake regulator
MLEKKLTSRNIKPTAMRLLVLKQLVESSAAISLKKLEEQFERVDRVTLYRTIKTFEEKRLIHAIEDGSGPVKYALCEEGCECEPQDQHTHFHCTNCNETFCLTQSVIPETQIPTGFKASSASMMYKGVCPNCN